MSLIGIDIGGTHTRIGLVSAEGKLLRRLTAQTGAERGPEPVMAEIANSIRQVLEEASEQPSAPLSIGIGVTGPVDIQTGIVTNPHTLAGWPPTDLIAPLRKRFPGAAIAIDNDANTAALGEWSAGAGRKVKRFAMITVGTGIGAAFLIEGEIQRSTRGRHGEAGHQLLDPAGPVCYCGARGCWESLASGTAFMRRLGDQGITADDPRASPILQETARWIGLGLVNICSIFEPDTIAIGGGMSTHFDGMRQTIVECLRAHQIMVPTDIRVECAQYGDDAGVIGAALLTQRLAGGVDERE